MALSLSLLATFVISLVSLLGVISLSFKHDTIQKIILYLVALSAGSLIGTTFFHLLPESVELLDPHQAFQIMFASLAVFFLLEKILHWRHCHKEECSEHSFGYINLVGDGLHNFIDGMVIFAAFNVSVTLGLATTIAVLVHELPQELGDFGVLLHAGFNKSKAILFNFATALTAMGGALLGFVLSGSVDSISNFLIPIAAGSFLYIALSDLLPELRKKQSLAKTLTLFGIFLLGALMMMGLQLFELEH